MLYVTRLTQNQNDSINSILQYSRVVRKDCCVVLSASGFPYLILCPRKCKGKVATIYLKGLSAIKIFQYKNLLLLKLNPNYKKWHHSTLQSLRKKKNNNFFIMYIRRNFRYGEIFL